eukprot:TRINITY_DN2823_c0_g1_i1.p1 TRINITY_DN2823_c0_g1~~TRINITY_DN2823_c0_g1_i1.p1  ORF type:complete len:365 (-),score=69.30 TRINITY_DN2823_c0_g1_i1:41-1135(-)
MQAPIVSSSPPHPVLAEVAEPSYQGKDDGGGGGAVVTATTAAIDTENTDKPVMAIVISDSPPVLSNLFVSKDELKRFRRFSSSQRKVLEFHFNNGDYWPSKSMRDKLSLALKVPQRKIQIWFQNQRAKFKEMLANKPCPQGALSDEVENLIIERDLQMYRLLERQAEVEARLTTPLVYQVRSSSTAAAATTPSAKSSGPSTITNSSSTSTSPVSSSSSHQLATPGIRPMIAQEAPNVTATAQASPMQPQQIAGPLGSESSWTAGQSTVQYSTTTYHENPSSYVYPPQQPSVQYFPSSQYCFTYAHPQGIYEPIYHIQDIAGPVENYYQPQAHYRYADAHTGSIPFEKTPVEISTMRRWQTDNSL